MPEYVTPPNFLDEYRALQRRVEMLEKVDPASGSQWDIPMHVTVDGPSTSSTSFKTIWWNRVSSAYSSLYLRVRVEPAGSSDGQIKCQFDGIDQVSTLGTTFNTVNNNVVPAYHIWKLDLTHADVVYDGYHEIEVLLRVTGGTGPLSAYINQFYGIRY